MKFTKGLFAGLGIGIAITLGIFVLAWLLELVNFLACNLPADICIGGYGNNYCGMYKAICGGYGRDNAGCFAMWNTEYFANTLIFCTIIGGIIGAIYGVAKQVEENNYKRELEEQAAAKRRKKAEEEARAKKAEEDAKEKRKRQDNASAYKDKANATISQCEQNKKIGNDVILTSENKSSDLQAEIWSVINDIFWKLQKLENTINEINAKGDK